MIDNFNIENSNSLSSVNMQKLGRIQELAEGENGTDRNKKMETAARGFESMFVHMMIKQMKSSMLEEKEDKEGFGADVLMGYSDMLLAESIADNGKGIGIAEMIYKQLSGEELPARTKITMPIQAERAIPQEPVKVIKAIPVAESSGGISGNFIGRVKGRLDNHSNHISAAAQRYGLPENLIKAVISTESAGRHDAVSSAGAKGLMQLMDGTAKSLGVNNSFDPAQNIYGGAKYLRQMLDRFDNNLDHALAAYNAGPGNVRKYDGVPPFKETINYIARVKRFINRFNSGE